MQFAGTMRDFRTMRIWREGISLTVSAYELANSLPVDERFGLKSQIKRAAVSIPSNIAEGCSRASNKEFKHFLEISLGSAFEVESDMEIASRLKMIPDQDHNKFLNALQILQRRINTLISQVKDDL